MDQTESVFIAQSYDELGKGLIGNTAAQLAIERVHRHLPERIPVNFVNGAEQLLRLKERPFDGVSVAFEPLVGAKARARRAAQLSAYYLFLRDQVLDSMLDQGMVLLVARESRGIRCASGCLEDLQLGLGDALPPPGRSTPVSRSLRLCECT